MNKKYFPDGIEISSLGLTNELENQIHKMYLWQLTYPNMTPQDAIDCAISQFRDTIIGFTQDWEENMLNNLKIGV